METNQQRQSGATEQQFEPTPPGDTLVWDVLTVLIWLGIASLVMMFVTLAVNPSSQFNPFPPVTPMPPTLVAAITLPTQTHTPEPGAVLASATGPTARSGRATRTPTASPTPVTPTITPTRTPLPTETPTPGPSPTPTVYSLYPFMLFGDVNYIAASTFPDHSECRLWVAGQAYDLSGAPMVSITIRLGGYLNGNLEVLSLTGTATQYGRAGYEFLIADAPVNSTGDVWVQLYDQASIPLSSKVYFDTFEDCSKNLILINFKQVR